MTDHDLLIEINQRLKNLEVGVANHLRHHWAVTIGISAALLGALLKLVLG